MSNCTSIFQKYLSFHEDFPIAQTVKNLPAMQEIWVRSLAWEYPLEKEMAAHSSTLAFS